MKRIGILLGSSRPHGNNRGLETWIKSQMNKLGLSLENGIELVHVYPQAPMHPLGPFVEDAIPAMIKSSDDYPDEKIREWSKLIISCQGFIILTPQYNWGYPGDLKNALDHLYHEWQGKPVLTVTYGGHGGNKCSEQLKQVLTGLKMKVIEETVCVTLPSEYIRTNARITPELVETSPQFLVEIEEDLKKALVSFRTSL